ncbi:MAG TPA: hypothetical protein VFB20_04710 [Burkholderiales bacterium]|nr:hypothetical protein [Burkholderiales bacterium]
MQRGQVVLVDTNIIIESVRVNCWNALTAHFSVETVEKCREEARTGQLHRPGYVVVDEKALRERLKAHPVSDTALAALSLRDPEAFRLDPGERHLWAHAFARTDGWVASCCDLAAVQAAVRLGWEDRLKSLEELAQAAGANPAVRKLKEQFSAARLSAWRTAALLERGLK